MSEDQLLRSIRAIVDNGLHLDAMGHRNAAANALEELDALLKDEAPDV